MKGSTGGTCNVISLQDGYVSGHGPFFESDPRSVPHLTEVLLAEWAQIPADTLQDLVERLHRGAEAVIETKQ